MPQTHTGSAGLVLAAGGGTRLGGGKLLLPWKDSPLLVHVVEKALSMPSLLSVSVVLGHQAEKLQSCLETAFLATSAPPLRIVHNPRWEEGLSTSLQCGLKALLDSSEATRLRNILVLLGDLPLVREDTLALLCKSHHDACAGNPKHAATIPTYLGKRGNPVVLSRLLFPLLFTMQGDTGARSLLTTFAENALFLPVNDQGILLDIDSPEDYAALPADL